MAAPFTDETFAYLEELALNNERDWFNANRERYESAVREPALEFIREMAPELRRISPHFTASDKKQGGSLMRVFRDVRFSPDKTPYKTNIGIQFRHERAKDVHAPGFYIHVEPGRCFLGTGSWMPDKDALAAYRTAVAERTADWRKAQRRLGDWKLDRGQSLKRPPRGFSPDHPAIDDIKLKWFILSQELDDEDFLAEDAVEEVAAKFRQSKSFLKFLADALKIEF